MTASHKLITLTSDSIYLREKDPVKRSSFRVGDSVVICSIGGAITLESLFESGNQCPYCHGYIGEHTVSKTPDAKTEPGPTRKTLNPWGIVAVLIVALIVMSLMIGVLIGSVINRPAVVVVTQVPSRPINPTSANTQTTKANTPAPAEAASSGVVQIYWFIGLGTGSDAGQVPIEKAVVDDFNRSQNKIHLNVEIIPFATAKDTLSTEIASGNGPDLVGPVGWAGSNAFFGQWADLTPLIAANNFDTSVFDPSLVQMYQTPEGQVGLPFAVYPSALIYNTALFDQAGLQYPPARYGDKYQMPDGSLVDWNWDTLTQVARILTRDSNGRNSTEAGFNRNGIVQYGFSWNFENQPEYWGAFWQGGSELVFGGSRGSYQARIPDAWKASWEWMYEGIWGYQPFIPSNAVEQSADFGNGNPFNSGKIAITDQPSWYTCCMSNVRTWDFAAMPTYNGKVGGRIDADTFRLLKTSKHPNEAFQVMTYLETAGVDKLIVGANGNPPAYGAIPAIASKRQPFLDAARSFYPWVKHYDTLMAGLQYPDIPSAESYVPNFNEAWNTNQVFGNLLVTTPGLDLTAEERALETNLSGIYNK